MDYLILTVKTKVQTTTGEVDQISYFCVNDISRCKNLKGQDVIQYVMSGLGQQSLVEDVLCITPLTPTPDQYVTFKK